MLKKFNLQITSYMLRYGHVTATKDIVAFLATEKSTGVDATGLGSYYC